MSHKILTLAFALCSMGLTAKAGTADTTPAHNNQAFLGDTATTVDSEKDDTVNMYRITFSQPIKKVVLEDYCNLVIVPDTIDFLASNHPFKNFSYKFNTAGTLTLNSLPNSRKCELHLNMGTSMAIKTDDFSNAELHINNPLIMLSIETNDYSNVLVLSDHDSIRANTINIKTNDFSNAKFSSPVVATTVKLISNDYSNAQLPNGRIVNIRESQSEYATIRYGHIPNVNIYIDEVQPDTKPVSKAKAARYFSEGDWEFRFAWAFNNWGEQPYNGFVSMNSPYDLGTTFSSYQLELAYYPLYSAHIDFGLGLGYESDIYRFSNPYVALGSTSPTSDLATFQTQDRQDAIWSSRMVTRYVTLPLTIRLKPTAFSDFSISLTALPGLNYTSRNTGLKHKGESLNHDGKTTNREEVSTYMNPFKLDGRLTFTYSHISIFLQMASLPVNLNMDKKVYPIKLGFIFNLYDD